ncbi:hypothetical protein OFN30_33020, partial [Escherichia coli]|nr:hypothetical protein [Escherichia coli]
PAAMGDVVFKRKNKSRPPEPFSQPGSRKSDNTAMPTITANDNEPLIAKVSDHFCRGFRYLHLHPLPFAITLI